MADLILAEQNKRCSKCFQDKAISEFVDRRNQCNECRKIARAIYRERNKEKIKAYKARRRDEIKKNPDLLRKQIEYERNRRSRIAATYCEENIEIRKKCTRCGEEKSRSDFYVDKYRLSGRKPACIECERTVSINYANRNKDKRKEYARRRRKSGITQALAKIRYYSVERRENRESLKKDHEYMAKVRAAKKRYRDNNKDKQALYQRERYATVPEKIKEIKDRWVRNNKDYVRAKTFIYRDIKRVRVNTEISELDIFAMKEAAILAALREKMIGGKWHVDHIEPLRSRTVSGLHNAFNIQVVPAIFNQRKGNKQISGRWINYC